SGPPAAVVATTVPTTVPAGASPATANGCGLVAVGPTASAKIVGTSTAADWFPATSVPVTTKLFAAFIVSGVEIMNAVPPAFSCWERGGMAGVSAPPSLLASRSTFTRASASAVPRITNGPAVTVIGPAGEVTMGAAGGVESSVMAGTCVGPDSLPTASAAV